MPAPKLLPVFADNIPLSARDLNAFSAAEDKINLHLDRVQIPFLVERLRDAPNKIISRCMIRTHRYVYFRVSAPTLSGGGNRTYTIRVNGVQIGGDRVSAEFPGNSTIDHIDLEDPALAAAGKETHFQNPYHIEFVSSGTPSSTGGDDVNVEWVHEFPLNTGALALPHIPIPSFSNGDKVCAADLNAIADNYQWLINRDSYMPSRGFIDEKVHGDVSMTRRYNFIRNRRYLYFMFQTDGGGSGTDTLQIDVYLHTHHAGGAYNTTAQTSNNQIYRGDYPQKNGNRITEVSLDLRDGSTSIVHRTPTTQPEDANFHADGIKKNLNAMFADSVSGVPMGETYSISFNLGPTGGDGNWVQVWALFETPFNRQYI